MYWSHRQGVRIIHMHLLLWCTAPLEPQGRHNYNKHCNGPGVPAVSIATPMSEPAYVINGQNNTIIE